MRSRYRAFGTFVVRLFILAGALTVGVGVLIAAVLIDPYTAATNLLVPETPAVSVPGGDAQLGRTALEQYNCAACHAIPGLNDPGSHVGPPLTLWAEREYIAGTLTNEPANLVRWLMDPQAIEPGTAMPDLGVSEADARDMAAYLYTLEEE